MLKINIKVLLCFAVIIIVLIPFLSNEANAAQLKHNILRVNQEKTNWCWAGSARSILYWHSVSVSQSNFSIRVKGHTQNVTATDSEVRNGLISYGMRNSKLMYSAMTYGALKTQINESRPVYAGISWYNGGGLRTGGHAVVIRGYEDTIGTTYGRVHYMDPATGIYESMPYASFKGSTSNSTRHWDGSIYDISH